MIASTQITNAEILSLTAVLAFVLLSGIVLLWTEKSIQTVEKYANF